MKLRFFSDGVGLDIGNGRGIFFRLSNATNNVKVLLRYATKIVPMAMGSNFLLQQAGAAEVVWKRETDSDICSGEVNRFIYQAANGAPYQLVVANIDPLFQEIVRKVGGGSLSSLTIRLTKFAIDTVPKLCNASLSPEKESDFVLVQHDLPVPYTDKACNVSALLRQEGMLPDREFEKCLTSNLHSAVDPWADEFVRLVMNAGNFWANSTNLFLLVALICFGYYVLSPLVNRYRLYQQENNLVLEFSNANKLDSIKYTGQIPHQYICPITHNIMDDPVTAADNKVYERKSIQRWLLRSNFSPLLNTPLPNKDLTSNAELKQQIEGFVREKEQASPSVQPRR